MAQSDQTVQNSSFPTVRGDINDNLAALFSQSSGPSAPATTVAFQPWVDTSSSPAVWKVRNSNNTGWVTVGTIDTATFNPGGVTAIANGGTGQITAAAALAALLPSQAGNAGKGLTTDGTIASWGVIAAGVSLQSFTTSTTYTPTSGKTTFLVFATGGGGGAGGSVGSESSGGGGGGGTAIRVYTAAEMGANATVSIGAGGGGGSDGNGAAGGSTSFDPAGTGLTLTGAGGSGSTGSAFAGGSGGGATNSAFAINGQKGGAGSYDDISVKGAGGNGGASFWAGGRGAGGNGAYSPSSANGSAGTGGVVMVLEW